MLVAGRYREISILGKGGMGTVRLVEDTRRDNLRLALKTQDLAGDVPHGAFKREFEILSKLAHPNIARVHDFGTIVEHRAPTRFYYTSEYVAGASFAATIAAARSPLETLYDLTAQLLRALAFIHVRGIVHRDIKPANVLVCEDGTLKLLDFGIVSHGVEIAGMSLVGTPAYMAPEVIRGGRADPRSDLYALGISVFEVVVGRLPFRASTQRELFARHLREPPPALRSMRPDLPVDLSAFVERLLAKEPDARFRSAARALEALSAMAGKAYAIDTPETHAGYISSGRLVARDRELARLRDVSASRLAGRPGEPAAIVILGPFGTGKSRLLRELRIALQLDSKLVIVAAGSGTADPLALWSELVAQLPSRTEQAVASSPGTAIIGAAERESFAVVIDDLEQSADAAQDVLEAVLLQLALRTPPLPLVVIAACDGAPGAARDRVERWAARRLVELLRVGALAPEDTRALACSMLGVDTLPADAAAHLQASSHGNPFVLEQILRALSAGGQIERRASGEVRMRASGLEPVPATIADHLRERVARLSRPAHRVLAALAVWRRPADAAALLALEVSEPDAGLPELFEHELVALDGRGRVVLRPLLAEVAAASLPAAESRRLHALAARTLETMGDDDAAALAVHFHHAGDREREARYSSRAGLALQRRYANEPALRFLRRAIELGPASERSPLELAAAEIEHLAGRNDDALARIRAARVSHAASTSGSSARRGRTRARDAMLAQLEHLEARLLVALGASGDAAAAIERARRHATPGSRIALRIEAARAEIRFSQGQPDDAAAIVAAAVEAVEAPGDEREDHAREHAELLFIAATIELARAGAAAAEPLFQRARALFVAAGDRHGVARAMHRLGLCEHQRGRMTEAEQLYRGAADAYLAVGALGSRAAMQMNLGVLAHTASDYVAAIDAYRDALSTLEIAGIVRDQALANANLANVYCLLGAGEKARAATERALTLTRHAKLRFVEGYATSVLGAVARNDDDLVTAEDLFRSSAQILDEAGHPREASISLVHLGEVLAAQQRIDEARALLDDVVQRAREFDSPHVLGRALDARARLAIASRGELEGAADLIRECRSLATAARDAELEDEVQHTSALLHERRGELAAARDTIAALHARHLETARRLPPEYARDYFRDRERAAVREVARRLQANSAAAPAGAMVSQLVRTGDPRLSATSLRSELTILEGLDGTELAPGSLLGPARIWNTQSVRHLLDIIGALNAQRDVALLLEQVLDSAVVLATAERGCLVEWLDGAPNVRTCRDVAGISLPHEAIAIDDALVDEVSRTGASIAAGTATRPSLLVVPLHLAHRTIGVIWLEHRFRESVFGAREIELVQTLADQAGTALENARLLALARHRAEELEVARRVAEQRVEEQDRELDEVRARLAREHEALALRYDYRNIIGKSRALGQVFRMLDRVTDSDVSVLVEGESGTGKELVARALHANGPRAKQPFVGENCGAIPESLLEGVLFGHVKGAFTGAATDRKGLFELADGGTLFLDEVGEMPPPMQVKLLRALQEGEVRPLGAKATIKVNVRVVAATNRDLAAEVRAKRFREDLYYRLHVVKIVLPPLRDRRDDIPALAEHFLSAERSRAGRGPTSISRTALARLVRHPWPGNVRELENVIKNAFVMAASSTVEPADLIALDTAAVVREPVEDDRDAKAHAERERLRAALARHGGRVSVAARALDMPVRTLYYKLGKLGLLSRRARRP